MLAGPYCTLPINGKSGVRGWALVDPDVYGWAQRHKWSHHRAGEQYVATKIDGERLFLHRLVLGLTRDDKRHVDHINGDQKDCRRANLRFATTAENAQNQGARRSSTSKHRGVSWSRTRKKWLAQATLDGKNHNLGRFDSEIEAAQAAAAFRAEHMPYSPEAREAA